MLEQQRALVEEQALLAEQFDTNRSHLRAVAYRMLGSLSEADDAVQESWLRLSRSDTQDVENLRAWLTRVVARVCLDMLRTRASRREDSWDDNVTTKAQESRVDPHQEAVMAESVGLALLVVLQRLAPAERVAFVLHDMFDFAFDEIALIVDRSTAATRQLASRARRRVKGTSTVPITDLNYQHKLVSAFLEASRGGNFAHLLALLDPDVVLRGDHIAHKLAASGDLHGAEIVAKFFLGRAVGTRLIMIAGEVGAIVAPKGKLLLALRFTVTATGAISKIHATADPSTLNQLDLAVLDG